ncbi:periplasmic heavy metal sensor [Sneathiella chinensis]|uniref:Zinc resistance-associated protein n=1 Tax=Sneathiella chinensis TaxID=349750 RepID=A0ABQ5U0W1_9PROT|nr:periplasmic heavy metal sensor [Sneathiella chinensis]GLQ05368.1 hypothetical protein GCM10007924_05890 [Sneathiella chinensis]
MAAAKKTVLTVLFVVSLGLNVAAGAFLATQWMKHGYGHSRGSGWFDRHAALSTLSDSEKDAIDTLWRDKRGQMKAIYRDYRTARQDLARLLGQPELDLPAIGATQQQMTTYRRQIDTLMQGAFLEMARSLPPEKRQTFFQQGFARQKWNHHKDQRDD